MSHAMAIDIPCLYSVTLYAWLTVTALLVTTVEM